VEKAKDWLRLFRAQTAPATILLILTPYLANANLLTLETLAIAVFALLAHWISFGNNTLLDFALGYDQKDPSKQHFPLHRGVISLHAAHNVIHWSLSALAIIAILVCLSFSPNPLLAVISIFLWFVFGYSYNSGLSKESLFAFLPISICFTFMGSFGWFLSHSNLNMTGWLYLGYVFFVILFQIGWSGCLKELEVKERSNILVKMGAQVTVDQDFPRDTTEKHFSPGLSWVFGWFVKGFNLLFGMLLLWQNYSLVRVVIYCVFDVLIITSLYKLTKPRVYNRDKELLKMSLMEILSIYLVPWLMLDPLTVVILEVIGVIYFFGVNLWLWKMPAPKV
jgi:hypothetical protein